MTTLAQALANQENAQKSTGPTSEEGKFRAALNRLVHGFRSVNPVVTGESEVEYAGFKRKLVSELQPNSIEQAELVEQIAGLMWKRRRLDRMETALFEQSVNLDAGLTAVLTKFRAELDLLMRYKKDMRRELAQARAEFRLLKTEQLALEKMINAGFKETLEMQLEHARLDTEDAVRDEKLTAEAAQLHLLRGQTAAHEHSVVERTGWLTEKTDLHRQIWSLIGMGDLSRNQMAAMEGESWEEMKPGT